MKNKILITGGAGFIGSELIKLINNKKNIIVVDKIRNKKTISKFKKLKIKYIHGNLINKEFSKKIYRNIKTIYHLAGVVKVPSTDINLNLKKEKKIFTEATKIMHNLIKYSDQKVKVIFPSTHLVFENCKKNKSKYDEKSEVLPYLAYSRSKYECEKLLINNKVNFLIVRLGSVFGKTEDIKRMFNLPNLFPLRAKNNLDLKLFSRGIQIKSIISVKDVARAILFLSKKKLKKNYSILFLSILLLKKLVICVKSIIKKLN